MVSNRYTCWIDDDALTLAEVGCKMGHLATATRLGLLVPPAFVVTANAFRAYCRDRGLDAAIGRYINGLESTTPEGSLLQQGRELRMRITETELTAEIEDAVLDAYRRLLDAGDGLPAVALRSSSTLEDTPTASCAGMYDTFLMIDNEDVVCGMVRLCWASLFSDRLQHYLRQRRVKAVPDSQWSMAVGVQRMVMARKAGVSVSANPANGDRSKVLTEANWGLGEGLVKGLFTPDQYLVDKVSLEVVDQTVASKTHCLVCDRDTGMVDQVEVANAEQDVPCLSADELQTVTQTVKRLEQHFGLPQNVEWAFAANDTGESTFHLLQTRPQTALPKWKGPSLDASRNAVDHVLQSFMGCTPKPE